MYYKMTVLVEEDSLKNYLMDYGNMSDDEVENMSEEDLHDEAMEAVNGILSNEFSDYMVIDKNSLICGDLEVYEPMPNSLDYVLG